MGVLRKMLTGCTARVFATIPLATETEGQNHTLGSQALLSPSNRVNAVCDVAIHPPPSVFLALRYTSWCEWKLPDKTVALLLGESRAYALATENGSKIKPLTIGNIAKLTTFEAILHEIGQIWPTFCHLLRNNAGIRSKWPKFAENIPLASELQPKVHPCLRKSSQK